MAIIRGQELEISEFKFGKLIPGEKESSQNIEEFELTSLKSASEFKNGLTPEIIRQERENEAGSSFSILPMVKEHRGLNQQEKEDIERAVAEEVEKRLAQIQEQAYQDGMTKGLEEGRESAYNEAKQEVDAKISELAQTIENLQNDMEKVYLDTQEDAYLMVKNLSKWIILKEVDEKYYLARLLEKLIHEINSKTNLVLHVDESSFGYMPEIIKIVERKVGRLTNVRTEIDLDMQGHGIKLESENTIIDGSLEAQMESIDRLFRHVSSNEE